MPKRGKVRELIILALFFICAAVLMGKPVSAGIPVVSAVIVWNDGANTLLNVTVSHSIQTSVHYLDRIEVNVNGDNRVFPVASRPETTFAVQCNLGTVEAPTNVTIQAHCNVDGYSLSPYGPVLVPELSSMLLPLFVIATLLSLAVHRRRQK